MNPMDALKKAYQAQAITRDSYSLETFLQQEGVNGVARMNLRAIESKFVPSQVRDNGSQGYRTRFILDTGETVGTFSNGAHQFFQFYAQLLGHQGTENFLHIDIDGNIEIDISMIQLDGNKKTYQFDLVGGDIKGMSEYLPNREEIFAALPEAETKAEPKTEAAPKQEKK